MPHLTSVWRLARQLAGPDRAEDLTQETFLRAWTHFDQFDPASNCRAWLLRILHNTWISQWRKTRLELPMADVPESREEPSYEWDDSVAFGELSDDVQWALDQLPETFRWAVLLADVEELTYQLYSWIVRSAHPMTINPRAPVPGYPIGRFNWDAEEARTLYGRDGRLKRGTAAPLLAAKRLNGL